jgi:uncharacterized protein YdhG (YjbR/CyaY superfamily)
MKPKTVSDYISAAPKQTQKKLREMRAVLKKAAPGATEGLKWGSVAFSYKRILFTFAGFKKHIGFYPTPAVLKVFKKELKKFTTGKGSVQFPLDKPLPLTLIRKIALQRIKESKEKDARWM